MRKIGALVAALVLLVVVAVPSQAGNWYVGGGIESVALGKDLDSIDPGSGLTLNFGYRFTPSPIAVDVLWGASFHEDFGEDVIYGRFVIGPKFILISTSSFQPYLTFGLGGHALEYDNVNYDIEGTSFFLGMGFDYQFNPYHSLGVGLRVHSWEGEDNFGFTGDVTTTTLSIVYNYHVVP